MAEPKIEVSLSGKQVTADQSTILQIQAEWPKSEGAYSFALPDLKLQNLIYIQQGQSQENYNQGDTLWTRKIFTIELKAEPKKKEGIIGAFSLPYLDPETQKGGTLEVGEQRVRIHTPLPSWLWPSMGGILALASGVGGWLALRANKRKKEASIAPLQDAPELGKVKALIERRGDKQAKDLLLDLDATLRQFLTSYYQLGLERSAGENQILRGLKAKQIPQEEIAPVEKLFNEMGQAKFAANAVSESELRDFQREIIRYLETKKVAGTVS